MSNAYIAELKQIFDTNEAGVFVMSDLRNGRIVDMRVIQQLSRLSQHKNCLGSVAFTKNPISKIFASDYRRFIPNEQELHTLVDTPEEAIAFLEGLKPALTQGIDWQKLLLKKSSV